jgi:hypothetical protein
VDLVKVLTQLRAELQNLNLAIASLERLASQAHAQAPIELDEPKRPGRPRKSPQGVSRRPLTVHKRGGK